MMQSLLNAVVRLVMLAACVVFAASLLAVTLVLLALWSMRALWLKMNGRYVSPFSTRLRPRAGLGRIFESANPAQAAKPARPREEDVVDVQAKEIDRPSH